ncbi:MAG: GntR family transcriptional regulator [Chloroflexota bacterium]
MKLTNAEKAYRQIRHKIVTTTLPPGAVIRETDLMSELQLGRTPIREAIKQLQANSLVTITPRRGMFVTDISATDLTQIFEVRIVIETLAARLATKRINSDQLSRLRDLAESYKNTKPSDKEALINLDCEFHSLIAKAANNKFLKKDLTHYYNLSLRIWYLAIQSAQPEDIDVAAHLEILEEIEAGDADKAALRMKNHIEDFHRTIKTYL